MKRALIAMALLAAAAVGGAVIYQTAALARDYRQLIARGDAALAAGQTFAAIEDYSGALALRPDSMLAHLRRGETYRQRGDIESAARDFRAAAGQDPTATRPLEQWGDALYEQQRYKAAVEAYQARLRLDDRSAVIWFKVGLSQYRDRNLDASIAALNQALRLDDQMADAHYLLGLCLKEKNRPTDALAAFQKAIARAPGMISAREEIADLSGALGHRAEELEQLQVLAGLDGSHVERRVAVGLAHARGGHPDLAILTLGSALESSSDQPLIYAALGRVWLEMAESRRDRPDAIGKALEALERAAAALTATSEVKTLYGRALMDDHQFEAAGQVLQQAMERYPVDPQAFAFYASVAEQLKHFDAARTALVSYDALAGDDAGSTARALKLGDLSLALNDPDGAIRWLERARSATPDDVRVIAALADADLRSGRRDDARQLVARGLALEPTDPRLLALSRRTGR